MRTIKKLVKWCWHHNEWTLTFPVALLLFWVGTSFMQGENLLVYDMGILQKPVIASAFLLFAFGITRLVMWLHLPSLYNYSEPDSKINGKWKSLTEKERTWLSVAYFLVIFLSLVILMAGI